MLAVDSEAQHGAFADMVQPRTVQDVAIVPHADGAVFPVKTTLELCLERVVVQKVQQTGALRRQGSQVRILSIEPPQLVEARARW